jgi:hypothetical protein
MLASKIAKNRSEPQRVPFVRIPSSEQAAKNHKQKPPRIVKTIVKNRIFRYAKHQCPRLRRMRQISCANRERCSGGVACMIATATGTSIASLSPLMARTAVIHWPKDRAPSALGLNCRVRRPSPARRNTKPIVVLQARQVQAMFSGVTFSSWPSMCPTSTFRVEPQNAQMRGPGGRHSGEFAR